MLRAVVDPGVLISAFLFPGGPPARLYLLWIGGEFEIVACPRIFHELTTVLHRAKFRPHVTLEEADDFIEVVRRNVMMRPDPAMVTAVSRDPKDDYLVALARDAHVDALISGDHDLTELVDVVPPVRTPAQFIAMLSGRR